MSGSSLRGRLGITEGQAYTLAIGLAVALVTAAIGIPPTLRDQVVPAAAAPSITATTSTTVADPGATGGPPGRETAAITTLPARPARAPVPPRVATPAPAPAPDDDAGASIPVYDDGGSLGEVLALAAVGEPGAPSGVAVDPATGSFYVATDNGDDAGPSVVQRYAGSGTVERAYRVEGQPAPRARGLTGAVLDGAGNVFVLDASAATVLRIDADSGDVEVFAAIHDVGVCTLDRAGRCELSPRDAAPRPQALAMAADGGLFVADAGQGIVWRVDRFGSSTIWAKAVELLGTDDGGPSGIAIDGDGDVVVTVATSLVALTGVVLRIPVADDGRAGSPEELYRSAPRDAPAGLAVGASGRIYVALAGAGTGAVAVLEPDGTVAATVTSPLLGSPTGVAFRGRSLLVTNRALSTVVRVPTEEGA